MLSLLVRRNLHWNGLKKHATSLIVRGDRICTALIWLKKNNPLYHFVHIDEHCIQHLENSDFLPFHIEHIVPSENQQFLQLTYNSISDLGETLNTSTSEILFQSIVVTNVDCNASSQELHVAAIQHVF